MIGLCALLTVSVCGCGGGGQGDRGSFRPIVYATWSKVMGGTQADVMRSVIQASDDSYVFAGFTNSAGEGLYDMYVIRISAGGATMWSKHFGGPADDKAMAVGQTADGGFLVAGYAAESSTSTLDVNVLKLNSVGDIVWQKRYEMPEDQSVAAAQMTDDGGMIIVGATVNHISGHGNVMAMKVSASGDAVWTKTYTTTANEFANAVQATADGGFIIAGYTQYDTGSDRDYLLIKIDSAGEQQWTRNDGGLQFDRANSVVQTSDGGYIVAGVSNSFSAAHDLDAWVVKYSSSGTTVWTKSFGGTGDDAADCIAPTSDGAYILSGYSNSFSQNTHDVWVFKMSASGQMIWEKVYGKPDQDEAYAVKQAVDGGYIVAGYTEWNAEHSEDIWVLKLNATGDCPGCDLASRIVNPNR